MINEVNGDVPVFNREIYNFLELRRELEGITPRFKPKLPRRSRKSCGR